MLYTTAVLTQLKLCNSDNHQCDYSIEVLLCVIGMLQLQATRSIEVLLCVIGMLQLQATRTRLSFVSTSGR